MMKKDICTTSTDIMLDETLYSKLKVIAKKEKRSLNVQMEQICMQHIKEFEKENGEIIVNYANLLDDENSLI